MANLTDEQRAKYLRNMGVKCPHCESTQITSDDGVEFERNTLSNEVSCNSCDETWKDIFVLMSVEDL